MSGFELGPDVVGKVATIMVCWVVLLKSAKDQFLGAEPPGQHVPPHVQYGTTCSLIMKL
jgi:hypothetical protein